MIVGFKECWHKADLEPGAQERWTEYKRMMAEMQKWDNPKNKIRGPVSNVKRAFFGIKVLDELDVDMDCHRRVRRDMFFASTLTSMFFGECGAFFNSESGLTFKHSLLMSQAERARHPPDIRSPHSNNTRPKEHWKEWDDISKKESGRRVRGDIDYYPEHWNLVARPCIAHLYREGVICPSYVKQPIHH